MKKLSIILCSVALLYGCGDDESIPASTTTLNQAQAEAVADALGAGLEGIPGVDTGNKLTIRAAQESYGPIEKQCDVSGTTTTSGKVTSNGTNANDFNIAFSSQNVFAACTEGLENSTDEITLNGTISQSGSASGSQDSFTITSKILGALDVTGTNITPGVCGIGLTFTISANSTAQTLSYSITGSVCGQEVNATGSIN